MYNLENNVEWTEELKTAFKKNTTYGSLIFHKEEEETLTGETITTGNNSQNSGRLTLKGNTNQETSILPSEYTQVDYIESSGTQYIDTNIVPKITQSYVIEYSIIEAFSTNQVMFGSRSSGSYATSRDQVYMGFQRNTNYYFYRGTVRSATSGSDNTRTTTSFSVQSYGNFDNQATQPFYLFALNNLGNTTSMAKMKLYSFKVYDNDVLVRDFIPCYRNSDNEVGLYDIVNDVFYTNAGIGAFTYGSVVAIPNPSYPQTVQVVKGNNTVNIQNGDNTQSQTHPISFPENFELCKIGDYTDEIIYQDSKWYKNKKIQKTILNGTEYWLKNDNVYYISITNRKYSTISKLGICDSYKWKGNFISIDSAKNGLQNGEFGMYSSASTAVYFKNTNISTLNDFKTYISSNNMILYYVLATPVLEEITDSTLIEQLNSIYNVTLYQGINTISTITPNESPTLTLNYTKSTNIDINESNYLKSIELKEHRYVPDTGFIGQAVAKMATINLTNEATEVFNLENAEFELKIGARYNDNIYYINYGNFIVDSAPENDDTNGTIKLTAYDYMIKFNKPYQDTITYPCTLRALLLNICNQAEIELMTNSFANENFEVENNQFEGKTLREVLQNIAKCAFTWARIRQDNKLYLDFAVSDTVTEEITINDYKQDNYKKANEYFGAINKVTYADNDIEGQEESVLDQGDIILHGIHELVIKNNYFAYTTAKKRELIQAGSVLFGLKYMPIQDLKMVGLIYLESNDIIKVYNVDETYVTSIPFCHTINYQGYTSDEITAEGITDNQKEYENKNTSAESNSRAEISVDRANKKIQSIVSQIGDRSDKETTITQDIDGIELEVSAGLNVLDTIEKRGEIETEEAIDAQVYSIELKGTKEYVAYLHSGDGYSGDSYSNGGII